MQFRQTINNNAERKKRQQKESNMIAGANGVNGYLSVAWQEVAACCCVVINREVLFFHLDMITQSILPDRDGPGWDRLMDEDDLRGAKGEILDSHGSER